MCATVSIGRVSVDVKPIPLSLLQSSHLGLARAPIMCSHFPHGNEHVITCLARLFFASCTALELIHEPRIPCFRLPSVRTQLPRSWLPVSSSFFPLNTIWLSSSGPRALFASSSRIHVPLNMFPTLVMNPFPPLTSCPTLLCEIGSQNLVLFLK